MPKPYKPNDRYSQKAREENYRARSVYKLQELDQKYHLIKSGMNILDLAAAPGSWAQYASQKIGSGGKILCLDLKAIEHIAPNVTTLVCDLNEPENVKQALHKLGWEKADLILSDVAPSTSGIAELDHGRSLDLNRNIFELSKLFLVSGGTLVLKVFEGRDFQSFVTELKHHFKSVIVTKAHATRDRSFELYIVCK